MCHACFQNYDYETRVGTLKTVNEVNLFKMLLNSFGVNSNNAYVREFHQKSYVDFFPSGPYKSSKKYLECGKSHITCELSDIYLVVYCPRRKTLKHTFIQAKLDSRKSCNLIIMNGSQAELHQWDLLHFKPQIIRGSFNGQNFPSNILRSATYSSIGSYIFFDINRDFCFLSADIIKPKSSRSKIKGIVHNYQMASNTRSHSKDIEKIICKNSHDFFHSMYSFQIGSPINNFKDKFYLKSLLSEFKNETNNELVDEILRIPLSKLDEPSSQETTATPFKTLILCRAL